MTLPDDHLTDSHKLEADGIYDLFEFEFDDGSRFYFKNNDSVIWQGNTYDMLPHKIEGDGTSSKEEEYRPTLTVANPDGIFSSAVTSGKLDRANLYRKRVLRKNLEENNDIFYTTAWYVSRVIKMTRHTITLELRRQMDGQFFQCPARMFIPPEFPAVSLR